MIQVGDHSHKSLSRQIPCQWFVGYARPEIAEDPLMVAVIELANRFCARTGAGLPALGSPDQLEVAYALQKVRWLYVSLLNCIFNYYNDKSCKKIHRESIEMLRKREWVGKIKDVRR